MEESVNYIELKEFLELRCCIRRYKMDRRVFDSFTWRNSNDGIFSMYIAVFKEISKKKVEDTLSKKLWCKCVSSKISSFLWEAFGNGVPTRNNLIKKEGLILMTGNKCCVFCSFQVEDVDHLLYTCNTSYDIWHMCVGWLEISLVGSNNIRTHICESSKRKD